MGSRELTEGEIDLARSVYGDLIDYGEVQVFDRPYLPSMRTSAPNGNIYYGKGEIRAGWYSDDISRLPIDAKGTFIHELAHVLQHQSGINVISQRLKEGGDYDFTDKSASGVPFEKWTLEEQASLVEELYYREHGYNGRYSWIPTESLKEVETGGFYSFEDPLCFPAHIPIAISLSETRPISDIRVGDTVLAFDPAADLGRGALVPRKVVRLYRNTTEEWVKLTWSEGGEAKELIATPGDHFLERFSRTRRGFRGDHDPAAAAENVRFVPFLPIVAQFCCIPAERRL